MFETSHWQEQNISNIINVHRIQWKSQKKQCSAWLVTCVCAASKKWATGRPCLFLFLLFIYIIYNIFLLGKYTYYSMCIFFTWTGHCIPVLRRSCGYSVTCAWAGYTQIVVEWKKLRPKKASLNVDVIWHNHTLWKGKFKWKVYNVIKKHGARSWSRSGLHFYFHLSVESC